MLVDDTAYLKRAASAIIQGGAYDNNLLCIGEKEVFVLDSVADKFMAQMQNAGAVRLNSAQLDRLTKAAFTFKQGHAAQLPHPFINKALIGKDASVLAKDAGVNVPANTECSLPKPTWITVRDGEQMMPFLPIVRVKSVDEGI